MTVFILTAARDGYETIISVYKDKLVAERDLELLEGYEYKNIEEHKVVGV